MKKLLLNSLLSVVTVNLVFTATIGFADSKRGKSFSFGGNSSNRMQSQKSSNGGVNLNLRKQNTNISGNVLSSRNQIQTQTQVQGHLLKNGLTTKHLTGNVLQNNHGIGSKLQGISQNHVQGGIGQVLGNKTPLGKIQIGDVKIQLPTNNVHDFGKHKHNGQVVLPWNAWCQSKPKHCHWWYNYCEPIRYCHPTQYVNYNCHYVVCNYRPANGVVIENVRWYLGLSGILLPGKGFAIEKVEAGSPAAQIGLQPGMVITHCNGWEITTEESMPAAIAGSNGVLQVVVLASPEGPAGQGTIIMTRVAAASF